MRWHGQGMRWRVGIRRSAVVGGGGMHRRSVAWPGARDAGTGDIGIDGMVNQRTHRWAERGVGLT